MLGHVSDNPFRRVKDTEFSYYEDHDELIKLGYVLSDFAKPSRGPKAELTSMLNQHAGIARVDPPVELEEGIRRTALLYPTSADPWTTVFDESTWVKTLLKVNGDAGPSWPFAQVHSKNKEVLSDVECRSFAVKTALFRTVVLSYIDPEDLELILTRDPLWAVENNLADPYRLFIKKEPTKKKKVETQFWRLINNLSLVDNLVDRILFTPQDSAEIATWPSLPSKCGSGLTDEDADLLVKFVEENALNLETDMSHWDITVQEFLMKADIKIRSMLNNASDAWLNAANNVTILAARRVLMTSDGKLYKRETPGGVASGKKTTSSSNSRMRTLVAQMVGVKFGFDSMNMSQGDDAVEYLPDRVEIDDYISYMSTLGLKVKMADRCSTSDFGFCSQRFVEGKVIPEFPSKMLANFFNMEPQTIGQGLESLKSNMRHTHADELLEYCEHFARSSGSMAVSGK